MIAPMLAKAVGDQVPETPGLLYEPKWDGFRCIVFREADSAVVLQSRKEEDFSYLFPEVVSAAEQLPAGTTLDGELVIVGDKGLEFDLLSNRIRPRSEAGGWKIASLSEATPARFVAFDILRHDGQDVSQQPFAQRRELLESLDLPADRSQIFDRAEALCEGNRRRHEADPIGLALFRPEDPALVL